MRKFYLTYIDRLPEKCQMPSGKFALPQKSQTPSGEFAGQELPQDIQATAFRKLRMLNQGHNLNDLRIPPANRLEQLSGNRAGQYRLLDKLQSEVKPAALAV